MVIGMVIAFVLVGCNNDDEANETSDNQVTEDSTEASETTGEGETDEAEGDEAASDETDSSSDSEVVTLSLGETGTMKDTIGTYEVTPTAFHFLKEIEDETYPEPHNGVFIVMDVTIKNIDDKALESSDIGTGHILDSDGGGSGNMPGFSPIEDFEGEIAPGAEVSGQLIFDRFEHESYQLVFGYGLGTVSNEVTWEFTADEAE